ncbi:MAG: hypothetical protein ACO3C1_04610 [Ilumatobacteraceae bacterium]
MATNDHHDEHPTPPAGATTPAKKTAAKKTAAKKAASPTTATKATTRRTTTTGGDATATAESPVRVPDPIAQIDEILAAELQRAAVTEPQMRLLLRALRDCGLGVTSDDVRIDEATRKVTITLSWAATKQLTNDLQDIAEERPIVVVAPPDGPTLFDPLPPAGPVAPQQAGSGLHIEVPA